MLSAFLLISACSGDKVTETKKSGEAYTDTNSESNGEDAEKVKKDSQAPDNDASGQKGGSEDVSKELEAAQTARQNAAEASGDGNGAADRAAGNEITVNSWDGTYTDGNITVTIWNGGTENARVNVEEEFKSDVAFAFNGDTAYGEHFYDYAMMFGEGYMEENHGDAPQETRYMITLTKQEGSLSYSRTVTIVPAEGGEPQAVGSVSRTLGRKQIDFMR